jgi:hypothetical protein
LTVKPKHRPQGSAPSKKLNTAKFKAEKIANELSSAINATLSDLDRPSDDIEASWTTLRHQFHEVSLDILDSTARKHQDWFDENDDEIRKLLNTKRKYFLALQSDPASPSKKAAFTTSLNKEQNRLHSMQDKWLGDKADEIQSFANRHDSKCFFDSLKAIYSPPTSGSAPLLSADGTPLLTNRAQILEGWRNTSDSVINRISTINKEAINRLPQVPENDELDSPPTDFEVNKAIKQLSCGKAAGPDVIPAEIYKSGGGELLLVSKLTDLLTSCWEAGAFPQEFKDTCIVHLYKQKENVILAITKEVSRYCALQANF